MHDNYTLKYNARHNSNAKYSSKLKLNLTNLKTISNPNHNSTHTANLNYSSKPKISFTHNINSNHNSNCNQLNNLTLEITIAIYI